MGTLTKEFKEDLTQFREMTEKFYRGEVSVKDYKGFSGGFGSYAQRGGRASMLRLRLPGGVLTRDRLGFVAQMIEEYGIDRVHFTTCQTIQFHNLDEKAVCEIMEKALDFGIITRGGGGDFPRNVMVSPLSGTEVGEYFDVLPYAQAASDYLLTLIKEVRLPRKLKVCFSNSPKNMTHATFRDLGFAAREDGCFDVYAAGGLGNNPRMGVRVAEGVSPTEVLYYIRAMVEAFIEYGDYQNRGKARTRYMQEKLGAEGFKQAYLEKLEMVRAEKSLDIAIEGTAAVNKEGSGEITHRRIIPQKQRGLYTVVYHPLGGVPAPTKFGELYKATENMQGVQMRLAPDETMYIINLTAAEAEKILEVTKDGAQTLFETSVACIGSTICQVGLRDSQGALKAVINQARFEKFGDGVLPQIHISGCVSSCGTHQIGKIGFHGGVKRVEGKAEPAFTMHINGTDTQGNERFGEQLGVILQSDMPAFFAELGREIESQGKTYDTWYAENPQRLIEIAQKYLK